MTGENLYNVNSLEALKSSVRFKDVSAMQFTDAKEQEKAAQEIIGLELKNHLFDDSSDGIVIGQNLNTINPRIYMQSFPRWTFLTSGITVSNIGGWGSTIQSSKITPVGNFKSGSNTDDSSGKITLANDTSIIKVEDYTGFSSWTEKDIRRAELQNINLVNQFLTAQNMIYQEKIDLIGYVGDGGVIPTGILNFAGFPVSVAGGIITSLTPQQMYDEIADIIVTQRINVQRSAELSCNTLFISPRIEMVLQKEFLNTAGGLATVYSAIETNFGINIISTFRVDDVGGASAVLVLAVTEQALEFRLPIPFNATPIDRRGNNYEMEVSFHSAGCDILENDAGAILTGL